MIDATHVTTEFNTLFETITSISEKVDPVKLNLTLTATAEALQGWAPVRPIDRQRQRDPWRPQPADAADPQDIQLLADLAEVYANAAPDLFDGLDNAVTTARTLNEQQGNLDQALMASIGFGNTGGDIFERGGPYLVRGAEDLLPTAALLDEYSPMLFCFVRNYPRRRAQGRGFPGRQRLFTEDPLAVPRCRQPVRLSGQPAPGERQRRTGGPARLLAARDP